MPPLNEIYRKLRRPYRVRWNDLGPPRLEPEGAALPKSFHRYGSLVERITRIFLTMEPETVERVLQTYRMRYGDGAYAYAKRTIGSWRQGQVRHVGQTVMRLLEVVPMYVDIDTKFELCQIMREETLRRLRQTRMQITLRADEGLESVLERCHEVAQAQIDVELPPGYLEMQAWLTAGDALVFQRMIREAERKLLAARTADFAVQLKLLQRYRPLIGFPARLTAVFELPTACITVRVMHPKRDSKGLNCGPSKGVCDRSPDLGLHEDYGPPMRRTRGEGPTRGPGKTRRARGRRRPRSSPALPHDEPVPADPRVRR
jgi:hypothetical protein